MVKNLFLWREQIKDPCTSYDGALTDKGQLLVPPPKSIDELR